MRTLYTKINEDTGLTDMQKNAAIQRNGVFFREAYVFTDGLVNSSNQISDVKIGTKTYKVQPFIPAEPYILPINLDPGESDPTKYYKWNFYALPETILSGSPSKFIFSQGVCPIGISDSADPQTDEFDSSNNLYLRRYASALITSS
jgi:hypothetical protein